MEKNKMNQTDLINKFFDLDRDMIRRETIMQIIIKTYDYNDIEALRDALKEMMKATK